MQKYKNKPKSSLNLKFKYILDLRVTFLFVSGLTIEMGFSLLLKQMKKPITDYYGLIFKCPVGSEMTHCKYKKIRKLPLSERLTYFNALTEPEQYEMIENHQVCLSVREKKSLFHESQ